MNRTGKYIILIFLLAAIILPSGCKEEAAREYPYCLYYLDSTETRLVSEGYEPEAQEMEGLIGEFVEALGKDPQNFSYKKAKPDTIVIKEYWYDAEARVLTLNFDAGYSALTGVGEVLCRAAIVRTLCQVDGVDNVAFQVNGLPLMNSADKPVGRMNAEDFIDNTSANVNVTVYFANEEGTALLGSDVTVTYDGTLSKEQIILGQLLNGPLEEERDVYPTVPDGTEVLGVTTKDGICYVDLSAEFMQKRPEVSAEVTVYSIVNSLVELATVNKVQFTINGEVRKSYDSIDFSGVFERNLELIESGG